MADNIIVLSNVEVSYRSDPPVIAARDCDLVVAAGEHVALMGRSGSGKTSLMNVIGLLTTPSAGSYVLAGTDTTELEEQRRATMRAQLIGFVFQAFWLMRHRTVLDNVAAGLLYRSVPLKERRRAAHETLGLLGMVKREDFLPSQLSGGEQQRVAIARAIIGQPPVLLCDEPTGDLDSRTAKEILDLLDQQVAAGSTVVVITHDVEVAARAHRVLTMSDGLLSR